MKNLNNYRPMHATGRGYSDEEFEQLNLSSGIHVKSTNPIKLAVTRALKEKANATKVTNVRYHGGNTYSGDCMIAKKRGDALRLGRFVVELTNE